MINDERVKIIALYLPQFHSIPENSMWWGEDFTEWVNVKNAKPLFDGHKQPKVPLNHNYYDLSNTEVQTWQSKLAREYGIYGFCYYHYWFNGKMLLEKPMEQLLHNKEADIPFCISWANDSWTKGWVGEPNVILMNQTYGGETEWIEHYKYLSQFFKDERYIKNNNKPLFVIYKPQDIPDCEQMMECWKKLAIKDGFDGIDFAYQTITMDLDCNPLRDCFDYNIEFEPSYGLYEYRANQHKFLRKIKRWIEAKAEKTIAKVFNVNITSLLDPQKEVMKVDFSDVWDKILKRSPISTNSIPGAFARWDNTPRRGQKGIVYTGNTPELFEKYLTQQIKRCKEVYKKDMLFIYAWNEWAEGGFLEPDEEYGYAYLEAIRNALNNAEN